MDPVTIEDYKDLLEGERKTYVELFTEADRLREENGRLEVKIQSLEAERDLLLAANIDSKNKVHELEGKLSIYQEWLRLEYEKEAGLSQECAELRRCLNAIQEKVVPGEVDSVDALRLIIKENTDLKANCTEITLELKTVQSTLAARTVELEAARKEIKVDDQLLKDRNDLLSEFPCSAHGPCIPHMRHQMGIIPHLRREIEMAEEQRHKYMLNSQECHKIAHDATEKIKVLESNNAALQSKLGAAEKGLVWFASWIVEFRNGTADVPAWVKQAKKFGEQNFNELESRNAALKKDLHEAEALIAGMRYGDVLLLDLLKEKGFPSTAISEGIYSMSDRIAALVRKVTGEENDVPEPTAVKGEACDIHLLARELIAALEIYGDDKNWNPCHIGEETHYDTYFNYKELKGYSVARDVLWKVKSSPAEKRCCTEHTDCPECEEADKAKAECSGVNLDLLTAEMGEKGLLNVEITEKGVFKSAPPAFDKCTSCEKEIGSPGLCIQCHSGTRSPSDGRNG